MAEAPVAPIRTDEIAAAARVMAHAFAEAPRYRFLFPDGAERRARLPWIWGSAIRVCLRAGGAVHVARDGPGGTVLGVAIWEAPHSSRAGFPRLLRPGHWDAPLRLGFPAWRRRRALGPLLDAIRPPGPHWFLDGIGVEPSRQRAGLGSALLRHMLARIDGDALPAFLDTSAPGNLRYYERFGFRVTAEATLPNGLPLWGMTREPVVGPS